MKSGTIDTQPEREHVLAQLNLVTQTHFDSGRLHRVRRVPDVRVLTLDNTARTPEQAAWYLEHDKWEDDVISACGVEHCTTHLKLGSEPTSAPLTVVPGLAPIRSEDTTTEQLLGLVQRQSVSLADLYRKGRAKGLLAARSDYR